jgi:hypothetical protein
MGIELLRQGVVEAYLDELTGLVNGGFLPYLLHNSVFGRSAQRA